MKGDAPGTVDTERAPLENTFGWSRSRERAFDECPRRYYYAYYASWGGWEEDADPVARRLWLAKQMQSRHMWIGDLVHRTCAFALRYARHHRALPPEAELVRHLDHRMREEFRSSRADDLHETGAKHVRLLEHELTEKVPDGEWRQLHQRAVRAVRNFVASPVTERILATEPEGWLAIDAHGSFEVEGVPVSVRVDFAFDDGTHLDVVDWKAGQRPSVPSAEQVATSALHASSRWHVPIERVRLLDVNLVRNEVQVLEASEDDVREAGRRIVAASTRLRSRLDDVDANEASEDAFEKVESRRNCVRCVYQRDCLGGLARDVLGG